jgi:hypothetical protein
MQSGMTTLCRGMPVVSKFVQMNTKPQGLDCTSKPTNVRNLQAGLTHLMTPTNSGHASEPSFSTSNREKMMSTCASSSGLPVIFLTARCSACQEHR